MVCIPLAILQDILKVCQDPEEQLIVTPAGNYFVIHNYRGRKFATQFEGKGVMHIYMISADSFDCEQLDGLNRRESKVYDTHFMSDPIRGYHKTLDSFV